MNIFKIDWAHVRRSMTASWGSWGNGERLPVRFTLEDPAKVRMSEAVFVFGGVWWNDSLTVYRGWDIWGHEERLALLVQVTPAQMAEIEAQAAELAAQAADRQAERELGYDWA